MRSIKSWFKRKIEKRAHSYLRAQYGGSLRTGRPGVTRSSRSGGAKWPFGLSGSGRNLELDHKELRENARVAYHENSIARGIVERFTDSVADTGLKLESTPRAEILGITQEAADKWARSVEIAFDLWGSSKKQHRAANMTWYQSHRLYQTTQHRDGETFVRFFYTRDNNLLNPLQFEHLDASQIQGDTFTNTNFGPGICFDGIKRDGRGRAVAYKVSIADPANPGSIKYVEVPATSRDKKRLFMLHGFSGEYAGQKRGYSRIAFAIQEFENLTDFTSATIKKAINQASMLLSVENKIQDPTNPFEDSLTSRAAGPAAALFGQPTPAGADGVDEPENQVTYTPLPEFTMDTPGSLGIVNAGQGDEVKLLKSDVNSESFGLFANAFISFLTAGVSMPVEVLLQKFGQNYSASRAALIMFWRVAKIWASEMASDYLNPTLEMWLSGEIAAGRIFAPGWLDPRMRQAYLACNWIGQPMPNIDPMRTAKADAEYIRLGAQTYDRVARGLNGSSGAANRAKIAREQKELDAIFGKIVKKQKG